MLRHYYIHGQNEIQRSKSQPLWKENKTKLLAKIFSMLLMLAGNEHTNVVCSHKFMNTQIYGSDERGHTFRVSSDKLYTSCPFSISELICGAGGEVELFTARASHVIGLQLLSSSQASYGHRQMSSIQPRFNTAAGQNHESNNR